LGFLLGWNAFAFGSVDLRSGGGECPAQRDHAAAVISPDPKDLLKLHIYGYLNRVRSSRRLEAEANRNLEVIWLLRHLKQDHRRLPPIRAFSG
jgi:hypothetical protein